MKPAKTGTVEGRSQETNGADGGVEPGSWVEPAEMKELGTLGWTSEDKGGQIWRQARYVSGKFTVHGRRGLWTIKRKRI